MIEDQQNHRNTHIEEIDMHALLSSIYRRKILILFVFLISLALSFFLISKITPRYTASTIIQIEEDNFKPYRTKDLIQSLKSNVFNSSNLITELEVLKSRKIAYDVIQKLKLLTDPEFGFKPQESPYQSGKPEDFDYQVANRINQFLDHLKIVPISGANLVKIKFTSSNPQKAVRIVDTIVESYTKLKVSERDLEQEQITKWLESHADRLRFKIIKSEKEIQDYKTSNNLLDIDVKRISESQLEELNKDLAKKVERRFELQTALNEIKKSGLTEEIIGSNLEKIDINLIRNLKLDELSLKKEISELSNTYGPKHPKMIEKNAEIIALKNVIKRENNNVIKAYNTELKIITTQIKDIERKLQDGLKYINDNDTHLIALSELERDSDALKLSLKTFLESVENLLMRPEMKEGSVKVISDTTVPIESSYPNKALFISLSAFLSLLFSIILVLMTDRLKQTKLDETY